MFTLSFVGASYMYYPSTPASAAHLCLHC